MPRERWLHNIEHGAVVMLYDPCVLDSEVNKLRKIVRSCIKKHVITPTTFLSRERVSFKKYIPLCTFESNSGKLLKIFDLIFSLWH